MDQCIDNGTIPMFGYPLVCYSPIGAHERAKGEFWSIMYKSTMNTRCGKGKGGSIIG